MKEKQILNSSTPLFASPSICSGLETECLFGEIFIVEEVFGNWAFGRLETDGYHGWIDVNALGEILETNHRVCVPRSVATVKSDIKSSTRIILPLGSLVRVIQEDDKHKVISTISGKGFVPSNHLIEKHSIISDWVSVAEALINVPYRWGGRNSRAIDCSALVQLALQSFGVRSPRNTGDQQMCLGEELKADEILHRGDIVFWKGHVGIMQDTTDIIHANAFSNNVFSEKLEETTMRLKGEVGTVAKISRIIS